MNITVYQNNANYTVKYVVDAHRVAEGIFQINDEKGQEWIVTDAELYSIISDGVIKISREENEPPKCEHVYTKIMDIPMVMEFECTLCGQRKIRQARV